MLVQLLPAIVGSPGTQAFDVQPAIFESIVCVQFFEYRANLIAGDDSFVVGRMQKAAQQQRYESQVTLQVENSVFEFADAECLFLITTAAS